MTVPVTFPVPGPTTTKQPISLYTITCRSSWTRSCRLRRLLPPLRRQRSTSQASRMQMCARLLSLCTPSAHHPGRCGLSVPPPVAPLCPHLWLTPTVHRASTPSRSPWQRRRRGASTSTPPKGAPGLSESQRSSSRLAASTAFACKWRAAGRAQQPRLLAPCLFWPRLQLPV